MMETYFTTNRYIIEFKMDADISTFYASWS